MGTAVSSRRNAVAVPPAREGAGESVSFGSAGRTKKHGLRCDARALRTSPVGRGGGGGRQAGQENGDGEQGDDGRMSHPARRGGLADAAANTRKARGEMQEQEPGLLSAPKPSLASAAELVSPVWWGGGSNESREAHRIASRSRRQVLCSPYPCYGHVPRVHVASIGCSDQ